MCMSTFASAQLSRGSHITTDKLEYTEGETILVTFHSGNHGFYWHNGGGCGGGVQYQVIRVGSDTYIDGNSVMCCLLLPEEGYTKNGQLTVEIHQAGNYTIQLTEKMKRRIKSDPENPMKGLRIFESNEITIIDTKEIPTD